MTNLSAADRAACDRIKNALEAELQQLGPGSRVRGQIDDWAMQLETDTPGWIGSTPRAGV